MVVLYQRCLIFTPKIGEDEPILQMGWLVQSPPSISLPYNNGDLFHPTYFNDI